MGKTFRRGKYEDEVPVRRANYRDEPEDGNDYYPGPQDVPAAPVDPRFNPIPWPRNQRERR